MKKGNGENMIISAILAIVILFILLSDEGSHYTYEEPAQKKARDSRCDGDCENCPPHYGYRYGRYYYGHDHHHGCERGGNRCGGGMD